MADKIYSAEQITVPQALPQILKGFTKEVVRYNPEDIPAFAIELHYISKLLLCDILICFHFFMTDISPR